MKQITIDERAAPFFNMRYCLVPMVILIGHCSKAQIISEYPNNIGNIVKINVDHVESRGWNWRPRWFFPGTYRELHLFDPTQARRYRSSRVRQLVVHHAGPGPLEITTTDYVWRPVNKAHQCVIWDDRIHSRTYLEQATWLETDSYNDGTITHQIIAGSIDRPVQIISQQLEDGDTLCSTLTRAEYDTNGRIIKAVKTKSLDHDTRCDRSMADDLRTTLYFYDYYGRLVEVWIERHRDTKQDRVIRRFEYDLYGNWIRMFERKPGHREYLSIRRRIKYSAKPRYHWLIG